MCGIAGFVSVDGLDDSATSRAIRMRDIITHRGPDEAGLHVDAIAALAHRRLSIVDLSTGQQPTVRTKTAASGSSSTARSTTTPRSARELEAARPPVPHEVRYRNHRPRLRAVGRRVRAPLPRHVRVRDLGRAEAAAAARARSPRHQAALLGAQRRHAALRIGDQGDSRQRSDRSRRPNQAVLPEVLSTRYTSGDDTMFRGIHKLLPGHLPRLRRRRRSTSSSIGTFP